MNSKLAQLAKRRQMLIEQAARQRTTMSRAAEPWRNVLTQADKGVAVLRYLRRHPVWFAAGGGLMLTILGPSRVLRWLGRGWLGLQMLNNLRLK